jgi:hypothetical protein
MTQRASVLFKTGWIPLAIIGVAILVFGLIATAVPTSSEPPYLRAILDTVVYVLKSGCP